MKPDELARALTGKPITDLRLRKFAAHIHGTANGARTKKDDAFTRDALAVIEQQQGTDVRQRVEDHLTRSR